MARVWHSGMHRARIVILDELQEMAHERPPSLGSIVREALEKRRGPTCRAVRQH
jgi:hypothetical protein